MAGRLVDGKYRFPAARTARHGNDDLGRGAGLFEPRRGLANRGLFAGNTYTTVGYGDFVLPNGWRMLAPIIAMSGLFTFGWSGSVLVDFVQRINKLRDAAGAARARHMDTR
jgi:hypothetical protein